MISIDFKRAAVAAVLAASMGLGGSAQASSVSVDTVLSLVIDVSGSVDSNEYNLQRTGYVNAFNDAAIVSAITDTSNGKLGRIAVNVIQFASDASQAIGMTIIDSAATSSAFATALANMLRIESGSTAIGEGIDAGEASILAWLGLGNTATRKVIDVSGDGANNSGISPSTAGSSFCAPGVGGVINGIAILTDDPGLDTYYENNVACNGGFVLSASGFGTFDEAIKTKLRAEISGENPNVVPLPAGAWLLLGGLGGLAALRRRKRA
jgi:hypothetical protein